jgi:LPS-assembly protein
MINSSKILIFLFFFSISINQNKIYANEIIFNTLEINITNQGNLTKAGPGSAYSKVDNINIDAQSFKYDKISSILNATNGSVVLSEKNIKIKADELIYNKKLSTIRVLGNVEINDLTNNITIKSEDAIYQKNEKSIKSNVKSTLVDEFGNNLDTERFAYTLNDNLIKISNAKIIDIQNNTYHIDKAYLNLLTNKLIGKDIFINFNNDDYSEPRLKGKIFSSDKEKTIIEKGIFTTCKKNDDCPPWQFLSKKIIHNKKKKTVNYENAWLKIYDKPVFYFPKFFHPDPTVKRQSGFLMPSFTGSNSVGSAFSLPYFHVISDNKDLTFIPRLYSSNKILTQSEYRVINAKSKHTIDFSLLSQKSLSSKNHFFLNTFKELDFSYFDETVFSLKLENSSSDTYLKQYKLESPLINSDASTLTSSISLSASREDLSIETDFIVYENLNDVASSDKYEYVYPNYNISKNLNSSLLTQGNLDLKSEGYIKNYNTNIFEKVIINDFLFSSYPKFTNNGIKNNYNIFFKNINTDSKNSAKYKENLDTKVASLIEYNSSYPLEKKTTNYKNILKPIISARYSPNNSKNIRSEDRRIDANNVFSLNRIGSNDTVEGGGSLTYGTEFYKTNLSNREIFNAKIASVQKLREDKNLPVNSSLGKKTSDIVGSLKLTPSEFFKVNYEFSQDENLKNTNYQILKSEFKVNNFISTFEYLNDNNTSEKQNYLSNKTVYNFNETKSFVFETRENKKTKATEFYNLIYKYKNDCLTAEIQYNKDYYSDRDLKPNESLYLQLTIIPFGGTKTPNLKK